MRILTASDIHFGNHCGLEGSGPFGEDAHLEFSKRMHDKKPDALLVSGDCAEGLLGDGVLARFFKTYKNPHGLSVCIPGNHDMWLFQDEKDVEKKYADFAMIAKDNGWEVLVDKPINVKDSGVWLAGNMAWYDFSHIDSGVMRTPHDYEYERSWADYDFMKFLSRRGSQTPMMDFCAKRMAEFEQCLKAVPSDRKALVVATHFVGFSRLLSFFRERDYAQAFMANINIGKLVAKYEPDLYVCGHTHRYKEFQIGKTKCINNGSGYGFGSKRFDVVDLPYNQEHDKSDQETAEKPKDDGIA